MGLKSNISYNIVLTLSGYVIGLISFPYISRVLGVSNIGTVSFVDNIINYFILFSTLGASTIGTREIAKYKHDKQKVNTVFSNLIILYSIYTLFVLIVYFFTVTFIEKFNVYKELFYIGSAKLVFSVFLIEWLYKGLENFRYITTRTLLIKILYLFSLFIFVNNADDYKIYFILTTLSVLINSLINIIYSKKIIKFTLSEVNLKPFFKQSFLLGSYSILTSMYTTFNVMYLGIVSNTVQVGYYWAAINLYGIILSFFSAFTNALMPRMSSLLYTGEKNNYDQIIKKSFDILFAFSFPVIIFSIIHAPQIIHILSGSEFDGAILPMQIIMPLVMVVGIGQILAIQVLVPMQKDKIILQSSFLGASTGIISNIILVKKFASLGSALVLLISELTVTSYYILVCRKNRIIKFPWIEAGVNFLMSLPYLLFCIISTKLFKDNEVVMLIFSLLISLLYFIINNICFWINETVHDFIILTFLKIKKNNS